MARTAALPPEQRRFFPRRHAPYRQAASPHTTAIGLCPATTPAPDKRHQTGASARAGYLLGAPAPLRPGSHRRTAALARDCRSDAEPALAPAIGLGRRVHLNAPPSAE